MDLEIVEIQLVSRPGASSPPNVGNFKRETSKLTYKSGVFIKNLYLSVDPALRCRMNEDTGVHYMKSWQINEQIEGLGGIGQVEASDIKEFQKGDIVLSKGMKWPWATHFVMENPVESLEKIPEEFHCMLPKIMSCYGLIGLTVLLGIRKKGGFDKYPKVSNRPLTFVVSGAAGACGTLAGQIAKLEGAARVIGICGSDKKCDIIKSKFGYDEAINYKTEDVKQRLKGEKIWSYFDNVGGEISEAVVENMMDNGHIILCGQISQYNKDVPYPPPVSGHMEDMLKTKRITRERYLVLNYPDEFQASLDQLGIWMKSGKIETIETILEGIDQAPQAFIDMM